ncbi:hypothetical protein AYX22_16955 [Arthrobacter sp. D5-1]|nr:hypothetical protein AYX22_16955 [Arthrobacter sp. D5-1]
MGGFSHLGAEDQLGTAAPWHASLASPQLTTRQSSYPSGRVVQTGGQNHLDAGLTALLQLCHDGGNILAILSSLARLETVPSHRQFHDRNPGLAKRREALRFTGCA